MCSLFLCVTYSPVVPVYLQPGVMICPFGTHVCLLFLPEGNNSGWGGPSDYRRESELIST